MLNVLHLPNEIFIPIAGYENIYWVSDQGRVANARKVLKPFIQNGGYAVVKLTNSSKGKKHHTLHRLVANAFLENVENYKEVNHINGVKTDNRVGNLEWCTSSANKLHAFRIGLAVASYPTLGKKHKHKATSQYHNVSWDSQRQKWIGAVAEKGKTYGQKRFNTEGEAALYVNGLITTYGFVGRTLNDVKPKPNDYP